MRYLIYIPGQEAFLTRVYDYENNYADGMVVFDLAKGKYTEDGVIWDEIEEDRL